MEFYTKNYENIYHNYTLFVTIGIFKMKTFKFFTNVPINKI